LAGRSLKDDAVAVVAAAAVVVAARMAMALLVAWVADIVAVAGRDSTSGYFAAFVKVVHTFYVRVRARQQMQESLTGESGRSGGMEGATFAV
jgi:hypothetical protein